jgi:hypothetical protein
MREITSTEEMLACNAAIRERREYDPSLEDDEETEFALRQMWAAGRDYQSAATARPAPDDEALRAAERLVRECDLYDDYEPQSLISFEEDIRTVARYVLGLERRS